MIKNIIIFAIAGAFGMCALALLISLFDNIIDAIERIKLRKAFIDHWLKYNNINNKDDLELFKLRGNRPLNDYNKYRYTSRYGDNYINYSTYVPQNSGRYPWPKETEKEENENNECKED